MASILLNSFERQLPILDVDRLVYLCRPWHVSSWCELLCCRCTILSVVMVLVLLMATARSTFDPLMNENISMLLWWWMRRCLSAARLNELPVLAHVLPLTWKQFMLSSWMVVVVVCLSGTLLRVRLVVTRPWVMGSSVVVEAICRHPDPLCPLC